MLVPSAFEKTGSGSLTVNSTLASQFSTGGGPRPFLLLQRQLAVGERQNRQLHDRHDRDRACLRRARQPVQQERPGLTFDCGNRLRNVPGKEWYAYDGLGRRVLSCSPTACNYQQYTQAGQPIMAWDYQASKRTEYVYLGGSLVAWRERPMASETATVKYQHTDALGSPIAVTDASQVLIETSEYEPYGQVGNRAARNGPGFTGHVEDAASKLSYMQQRYYDPGIGRFLSVDPVTADAATGANFNRYWYANNNPYKFMDPDGRAPCRQGDAECRFGDPENRSTPRDRLCELVCLGGDSKSAKSEAREVAAGVSSFIDSNPNKAIPLSAGQLGTLANGALSEMQSYQEEIGQYHNMTAMNFLNNVKGGIGDSIFVVWAGESFDIQGMAGPYGGRHLGSDINYMMQGMSWAAKGEPLGMMNAAIAAWNVGQAVQRGGVRDLKQISHAQQWAEFGYSYYLQQSGPKP